MALGKYERVDGRKSSSSFCSTVSVVVFVALCLVGLWMLTSSSAVQTVDFPAERQRSDIKDPQESSGSNTAQLENSPGDLPEDVINRSNDNASMNKEEGSIEKPSEENENRVEGKPVVEGKSEDDSKISTKDTESKKGDQSGDAKTNGEGSSSEDPKVSDESSFDSKPRSTDTEENKSDESSSESSLEEGAKSKNQDSSKEIFPSGAQSEILNEATALNGSFPTQAAESKTEKEAQTISKQKQDVYSLKLCNNTAGPDFIPCLDNLDAIRHLRSTKHYEHRERHCPSKSPTCLVPLPEGYKRPVLWPKSREMIWYSNVPHTKLAEIKGHQNWVKVSGEYLTFPGGGTQFKHGALHYIEFVENVVREQDIEFEWGKSPRVVLDVGCGVASFGGYLFDKDVLTMSFAPKDEHEAQVQFALERGIPAVSAVMGTVRLPFPGIVFDVVHCARCRVPWHIEGGKLLLELNRVLRPGGFFIWSATPAYLKNPEDVEIWKAMSQLTKSMCWELVAKKRDPVNKVGVAVFRKPSTNECYEKRSQNEPPMCPQSDDRNAAWYVPLKPCMHRVPEGDSERGSQWPEQWPARLGKVPYWLSSSQAGVYGKAAPQDFTEDDEHWKRVVSQSYLKGMGINWSTVRNVMDMRAIYGGFGAALREMKVWVMNVVSIDSPDTLPIIYERGLFGMYHDWCESFSTYPRSYDLLHADHLFSKINKKCSFPGLVAEVDRILRPGGKIIVRDSVETITELESMFRGMKWEIRLTYSKEKEGLLCAEKTMWRPTEQETLPYAF